MSERYSIQNKLMLQSKQVEQVMKSALDQLKKINILVNGNVSCDHMSHDTIVVTLL